jgi:hypothetical protein
MGARQRRLPGLTPAGRTDRAKKKRFEGAPGGRITDRRREAARPAGGLVSRFPPN